MRAVRSAALMSVAALLFVGASAPPSAPPVPAAAALRRLMEGNARFVSGRRMHPNQSNGRRVKIAGGQHPFAAVLACADSRVAPELTLDQGLGDLFVVRAAGNVASDAAIGSFEYAVEHLGPQLILVLGHTSCGAVKAAAAGEDLPGKLPSIVDPIKPAVAAVAGRSGDLLENATRENVVRQVAALRAAAPILSRAVEQGRLEIVGGLYDLKSGKIELLTPRAAP